MRVDVAALARLRNARALVIARAPGPVRTLVVGSMALLLQVVHD
jgi:hypothetical protein